MSRSDIRREVKRFHYACALPSGTRKYFVWREIKYCILYRNKDLDRVRLLLEQAELDRDYLTEVLSRQELDTRLRQWNL